MTALQSEYSLWWRERLGALQRGDAHMTSPFLTHVRFAFVRVSEEASTRQECQLISVLGRVPWSPPSAAIGRTTFECFADGRSEIGARPASRSAIVFWSAPAGESCHDAASTLFASFLLAGASCAQRSPIVDSAGSRREITHKVLFNG